jgi:hypothetical protein
MIERLLVFKVLSETQGRGEQTHKWNSQQRFHGDVPESISILHSYRLIRNAANSSGTLLPKPGLSRLRIVQLATKW